LKARLELAREALGQADEVPPNSPASPPLSSPQTSLVPRKPKTKDRHHSRHRRNEDDDDERWERHQQREQKRYQLRAEVEERLTEEINRQTQVGLVIATKQQSLERARKRNAQAHGVIKDIQTNLATALHVQEKAEEELARLKRKLQKYESNVEAARQELAKAHEIIEQISSERDDAEEKAETARREAREALERMELEQAKAEGMLLGRYEGVLTGWEDGKYQGYSSARAKILEEEKQRMMQRRYELKEKYPRLDIDMAFDAVPSPDSSVDGLPLELLEKKAPISPPVFSNLPRRQDETTPRKAAREPHKILGMPQSNSLETLPSEPTSEPSPKPSLKPSSKRSKPHRERRRRTPSDPAPLPSPAPLPIERKARPKTHLPPPKPVFPEQGDAPRAVFHDHPAINIEPDKPKTLGRNETFRKIFRSRKPSMDEGPQEPIPDAAPFAPSLPYRALTTPLPPSRILEPMKGPMSPVPSMRLSPKFRAGDVNPTPQHLAEKELRKMERQVAKEKNKDKGVLRFMRRISLSKVPTLGHRPGHRASASMSNINLLQNPASSSAPAPIVTRSQYASISNPSLPSLRQAHPQAQPSPRPSLARPPPSPRPSPRHGAFYTLPDGYLPPLDLNGSINLPPPHELGGAMDAAISRELSPTPSARRSIPGHSRHNSSRDPSPSRRVIQALGGSIRSVGGALKKGASAASHLSRRSSRSKSRSPSPDRDSVVMDPHSRSRANSLRSQRSMSYVPQTQGGLLMPEAIQVPLNDEDDRIPASQTDTVPTHGRHGKRVLTGKSTMSTPMSQFSILDPGDRPSSQYYNSTRDALGLRGLRNGNMSIDEGLMEETTMKSYPSIAGLSVITERSERGGVSRSQTQRTQARPPTSTHQTPYIKRVPVPKAPEVHGLSASQFEGQHEGSSTGHGRPGEDEDKPPEPPMKSPRTKFAAVYNARHRPQKLTVPAPLAQMPAPALPVPRSGIAGIGAGGGGGRRFGTGQSDFVEDVTRPWTNPHKRTGSEISTPGRALVGSNESVPRGP
jgi:hypothetical protein